MILSNTGLRAISSSSPIPFPVPEHTGSLHFLLVGLGSCDRALAKQLGLRDISHL